MIKGDKIIILGFYSLLKEAFLYQYEMILLFTSQFSTDMRIKNIKNVIFESQILKNVEFVYLSS